MTRPDFGDQMPAMLSAWLDAQRELGELWLRAVAPTRGQARQPESSDPPAASETSHDGSQASATATPETGEQQPGTRAGRRRTREEDWAGLPFSGHDGTEALLAGYRTLLRTWQRSLESFVSTAGTSGAASAGDRRSFFGGAAGAPWDDLARTVFPWAGGPSDMAGLPSMWMEGLQTLYRDAFQRVAEPWLDPLRPPDEGLSKTDGHRSALSAFTDLYWDAYERTLGRLLESPDVGYRRELDERLLQTSRAWFEFRRASFDYMLILGEAWLKVLEQMMSELDSMARRGESVTSVVELLRLWTKVADRVLIQTFGMEEYAKVQGRLLNASMAYRLEERRSADSLLKMTHVASRSDLDEVSRRLHEVRREVRQLRKSFDERERQTATKRLSAAGMRKKPDDGAPSKPASPRRSSRGEANRKESSGEDVSPTTTEATT